MSDIGNEFVKLSQEASGVQSMLRLWGEYYFEAITKGKGDKWVAALRSYIDLVECTMPAREKRSAIDAIDARAAGSGEG